MATSLAAQLKKLTTPEAQSLLGKDFREASFLYDDKEAATYDRQHFYNIGANGLQQLIERDDRFREFEQSLFSLSSQSLQRYVQTSETNQVLDEAISKFLLLLSPYMQLREAHKAMEWMVHRYSVHLRNVDSLMMCVLPYHHQEPFIMALRLLKLSSNECAKWRWLEQVKKGNVFLPRSTLITHCRASKGFLGFICNMLNKHIETHSKSGTPSAGHLQRVISFYTQTVLEVIIAGPLTEHILSTLMPAITSGLKSHDLPDYMVCSYMVLSQLFVKTSLNLSLLKSFVNIITKNVQPGLLRNAIMVLVIMFQKQAINKVSKKAFKYLIRHSSLTQLLTDLSTEAKTEPFLTPFMAVLVQKALNDSNDHVVTSDSTLHDDSDSSPSQPMTILMDMLTTVPLEMQSVTVVARAIMNWFVANKATDEIEVNNEGADSERPFKVFKLLENRFSIVMDSVIEEMRSADDSGKVQKVVENLWKLSVASVQKNLTSSPMTSVAVCLHHRHGAVRKSAVEQLLQNKMLMEGNENMQAALVLRLQDDDPDVVDAVLRSPQKLWDLFPDKLFLYNNLQKKLATCYSMSKKNLIQHQVLEALSCVPEGVAPELEVIITVLSFMVALEDADLHCVKKLLESPVMSWCRLLAHLKADILPVLGEQCTEDRNTDNILEVLCIEVVNSVTSYLMLNLNTCHVTIESLYECLNVTPRLGSAALVILLVTETLIEQMKSNDIKIELQKQLVTMLSDLSLNKHILKPRKNEAKQKCLGELPECREAKIKQYISHLAKTGCLVSDLIINIQDHLEILQIPDSLSVLKFWDLTKLSSVESNWLRTMTIGISFSLELLAKCNTSVDTIGQRLFNKFFKALSDTKSMVKFMCMLWVADTKQGINCIQKACILQFSQVYFRSLSDADVLKLVNDPTPVLPCLLILLSSKFEQVREVAFNLLTSLVRDSLSVTSNFKWVAESILQYRQEVTKDSMFLSQVLKNILEEEPNLEPPSPKKRKKSSQPPAHMVFLSYLMDIIRSPETSFTIKKGILVVLHRLDTAESFQPLMPLLNQLVMKATSLVNTTSTSMAVQHELSVEEKDVIVSLIKRFTPKVAKSVENDNDAMQALLGGMLCPCVVKDSSETIQILTVAQLKRKFMAALSLPSRQAVLSRLLDVICSSEDVEIRRFCGKAVKHMSMESNLIIDELQSVLAKPSVCTVREVKHMKHPGSELSEEPELDSLPWKRVITLLEMVQSNRKVTDSVLIIPVAFQVLGRVLEIENKGSGEYIKQLLLGTINNICSRHEVTDRGDKTEPTVKGEHLNMDLIVQCIRSSDNPHTHHQALLLLSSAAKISPDLLMHNMMSVFTFMGANILRQDDAYTFHVIGRILENVIPALIMACKEKIKGKSKRMTNSSGSSTSEHINSEDMMTAVLRVFVDAIPHIPAHRKIILFEKLLQVLGPDKYLWRLILLFIESVTVRSSKQPEEIKEDIAVDSEKNSGPVTVTDMEFLTSLMEQFPGSQLCQSFHQTLTYIISLPEEKPAEQSLQTSNVSLNSEGLNLQDMEIFSIPYHTAKQLRHFKFALAFALNNLVKSRHLVAQLSEVNPTALLPNFQCLMETVLQLIAKVTQSHEKCREDPSSRFWRIFLHKLHDLLDSLVNLLPDSMFMDVIMNLMDHSLSLVQRRAIELLNTKLQQYKESLSSKQAEMLLSVTTKLQDILQKCLLRKPKTGVRDEKVIIGQTAMYSLKLLCRIIGKKNEKLFMEVLKICVAALSCYKHNGVVSTSSMLCIAEIVGCITVHSIEHMGEFIPLIISQLKSEDISSHEVLLLATVTSLQKIIEAVPLFLSPYLLDIIVQVCIIGSKVGIQTESHKPIAGQKVKLICTTLAAVTPTRTFLPVLEKSFMALQNKMASCAECVMTMLRDHIVKMTREDLTTFSQDLLKFFLSCFDIRATHSEISEEDLDVIEGRVIEAFVSLVFKLSEAQFRPMLLQIYSWATDEDASRERVLVFYRLCDSLAEKLKGLFTLFAGHIIKHASEVLEANNKSKTKCRYFGKGKIAHRKSNHLLCYVIDGLQKTFSSDTEGFLNKERFDIIMQPLVDQLENQLGKDAVSANRIINHVVPCLAALAAAVRDDSLWKDMNYQILLKTRHQSPKVRMWALSAVDAFHKQLGEDYTHLIPETIPFMAELMEDESDEVEKYSQKVLAAMEVSVGENLQEYF